jgi:hypothetical protein
MLTYFASLGLIKKPARYGLGKGKGSVSEYDDRVINDIKQIMKLHKEGFTYEQIRQKNMSFDEWLSFFKEMKGSFASEEMEINFLKALPYVSDRDKGRLKLTYDVTEHLTKVVINELESILGKFPEREEVVDLIYDVSNHIEGCLPNVFCDFGLDDEDYVGYLNEGKVWRRGKIFLRSKMPDRSWEKSKKSQKNLKSAKGGNKHEKKGLRT